MPPPLAHASGSRTKPPKPNFSLSLSHFLFQIAFRSVSFNEISFSVTGFGVSVSEFGISINVIGVYISEFSISIGGIGISISGIGVSISGISVSIDGIGISNTIFPTAVLKRAFQFQIPTSTFQIIKTQLLAGLFAS